jgi:hypothetical protein
MPPDPSITSTLGDLVVALLKERPGQLHTSKEITALVMEHYPVWCENKLLKSQPGVKLEKQLPGEISSQRPRWLKKYPGLQCTETSPRQYAWGISGPVTAEGADIPASTAATEPHLQEADLYPLLAHFLWVGPIHTRIYPRRINEQTSSNNLGHHANQWLHPDMVGLEDLMSDWHPHIRACAEKAGDQRARLWSFEVKLKISRSSVRRDYFQAVSNSSWANFGYLVAAEINPEADRELLMLHGLHGIGVILLDTDNPAESSIRIPARERSAVDWATGNRLAKENRDFRKFANLVANFYKSGETSEKEWDKPDSVPPDD